MFSVLKNLLTERFAKKDRRQCVSSTTLDKVARFQTLIPFVAFLAVTIGCSEEQRLVLPDGTLKGQVTYKGKPVPHAFIIVEAGSRGSTGNADENGFYHVSNVGPGEVRIGVNSEVGKARVRGSTIVQAQDAGKEGGRAPSTSGFVDVPKKYFSPSTSGIIYTIPSGEKDATFDVKLD